MCELLFPVAVEAALCLPQYLHASIMHDILLYTIAPWNKWARIVI